MAFIPLKNKESARINNSLKLHFKSIEPPFVFSTTYTFCYKLLLRHVKVNFGLNRVCFELLSTIDASEEKALPKYVLLQSFVNNGDVLNRNLEILEEKGYVSKEELRRNKCRKAVYFKLNPRAMDLFKECKQYWRLEIC